MLCTKCIDHEKNVGKAKGVKVAECKMCDKESLIKVDHMNICAQCSDSKSVCSRCGDSVAKKGALKPEERVKYTIQISQNPRYIGYSGDLKITCERLNRAEGNLLEVDGVIIELPFEIDGIVKQEIVLSSEALEKMMVEVIGENTPFSEVIETFSRYLEPNQITDLYYKVKERYKCDI